MEKIKISSVITSKFIVKLYSIFGGWEISGDEKGKKFSWILSKAHGFSMEDALTLYHEKIDRMKK